MSTTVAIADACARARCAMAASEIQFDEILSTLLDEIEQELGIQRGKPGQVIFDECVRVVSVAFNVPPRCVAGRRRTRRYARARHALTRLLMQVERMSINDIAEVAQRHKTSVYHSKQEADRLLARDAEFFRRFMDARERLAAVRREARVA
jgi:chromosomal replication initiation ATPase DnaA